MEKKIFISYGHPEKIICKRITSYLLNRGYSVWIDDSNIKTGSDWREEITRGINSSDQVIAMLSKHSVRKPGVCLDELSIALSTKGGNILTILLEPEHEVNPPSTLTNTQWLDMSNWRCLMENDSETFEEWFEEKMKELISVLESDASKAFVGDIEFIHDALSPIVLTSSKQASLLGTDYYGRKWLCEKVDSFLNTESSSQLCVVYGDPGIGKSAFAAHYAHYNYKVAATIFCEYDQSSFQYPSIIIRTLACLLACRLPDYRVSLKAYLEKNKRLDYNDSELFDQLLTNILSLRTIDGKRETIAVLIDGLDECGDITKNSFAAILAKYVNRLPRWIKFIVLSRRVKGVTSALTNADVIEIINDENNASDIRECFAKNLDLEFTKHPNSDLMLDALTQRSDGIFLYAKLMIDSIKKGKCKLNAEDYLPDGLSEAFLSWFSCFFPDDTEFEKEYYLPLCMIVASPEPLPVEELRIVFNWRYQQVNKFLSRFDVLLLKQKDYFKKDTITFSHRYISDWLCSEEAGIYHVDPRDGIGIMAASFFNVIEFKPDRITLYEATYIKEYLRNSGMFFELKKLDSKVASGKAPLYTLFESFNQEIRNNDKNQHTRFEYYYEVVISKMGQLLFEIGRFEDALVCFEKESNAAWVQWATCAQLLDTIQNLIWSLNRYAKCLENLKRYDEACAQYKFAFEFCMELLHCTKRRDKEDDIELENSFLGVVRTLESQDKYTEASVFEKKFSHLINP